MLDATTLGFDGWGDFSASCDPEEGRIAVNIRQLVSSVLFTSSDLGVQRFTLWAR